MAIWQQDYQFLPQQSIVREFGSIPDSISSEEFEQIDWWKDADAPEKWEIGEILPSMKSWSDKGEMWGTEAGDRIQMWFENDHVVDLSVRIDLRKEFSEVREFVQNIVSLAKKYGLALMNVDGRIILPEYEVVAKDISRSCPQEFINDPEGYLKRLSEEEGKC